MRLLTIPWVSLADISHVQISSAFKHRQVPIEYTERRQRAQDSRDLLSGLLRLQAGRLADGLCSLA